MLRSYCFSTLL